MTGHRNSESRIESVYERGGAYRWTQMDSSRELSLNCSSGSIKFAIFLVTCSCRLQRRSVSAQVCTKGLRISSRACLQHECGPFGAVFEALSKSTYEIVIYLMCFRITCSTCGKPTWSGCGRHIDSSLAAVPVDDRCSCKPRTQAEFNRR